MDGIFNTVHKEVASILCAALHMVDYRHFESANGCSLISNNWRMLHTITILIITIIIVARQNPVLVSTMEMRHIHTTCAHKNLALHTCLIKLILSSNTLVTHYNYISFCISCLRAGKVDHVTNSLRLWRAESSGLCISVAVHRCLGGASAGFYTSTCR